MQTEQQPQRDFKTSSRPHARPKNKIFEPTPQTAQFEKTTYAREVGFIMGALFITIGLLGFVVTDLMHAHLSYSHNVIHLISGVAAIGCAYWSNRAARLFAYSFGTLYGLLGILGFILGTAANPTVGHLGRDSSLWVLSPGVLEFGTSDHIIHLVIAAVFLIGATLPQFRRGKTPIVYH